MKQSVSQWGTHDGRAVLCYNLENDNGLSLALLSYGAALASVRFPDATGQSGELLLSPADLEGFKKNSAYFGATIGRCANRIGRGSFVLDGERYQLAVNNGPNHLHGGVCGFDKRVWDSEVEQTETALRVRFTRSSSDGEEGYPGELAVAVEYLLSNDNQLTINYRAQSSRRTPVNLTNHAYWNLNKPGSTDILDHELRLYCSAYIPVDETLIPTGEIAPVSGTAMDFRSGRRIGERMAEVPGGYDHCFVVERSDTELAPVAELRSPGSGRVMTVASSMPGVQFYSGNFLDGSSRGADGAAFEKHGGLCLETEFFPDAVNQPAFPSVILEPGHPYRHTTVHRFSVER